jgi:hypothetical protein
MLIKNLQDFSAAILCTGVLIFLSQILGRRLVNLAKFPLQSMLENFLVSQALGLATISYAIFFLGLIGAIKRLNFIIIFLIILPILFLSEIKDVFCAIKETLGNLKFPRWFKNKTFITKIALILLSLSLLLNFLNCLLPAIERDAMTYHLKMPQAYIKTGYVVPETHNIFSYFPQLVEMLYTLGLTFSNDYSSHLIHFYFGILVALTIFSFVRRICDTETALFSTLVFYSLPVVSQLSGWAYVDLALCFFGILSLYFFTHALENIDKQLLNLSAILLGLAFAVKYTTLLPLYAIIILIMLRFGKIKPTERTSFIREIFYFLFVLLLVAMPWYLRNILVTGNPFYPFFYSIFKGPYWDMERARLYNIFLSSYEMGRSFFDYILLPWRMSMHGGLDSPFDAEIGIVYLMFTPLLIFFRPKHKTANYLLIYSTVFFFAWAMLSQQARFLLPVFAALSICFYAIFDCQLKEKVINKRSLRLLAIALITYNLFLSWRQFQQYKPFEFIMGKTSRQQYLIANLKDYQAIDYINTHLPVNSKTYMVAIGNIGYYCQKPFMQESVFDHVFKEMLIESSSTNEILSWLKNQDISHILINELSATKYIYPDLDSIHLNTYKKFCKKHLVPIYTNNISFLYEILE